MKIKSGYNSSTPRNGRLPVGQNRGMSRIAQAAIDTVSTIAVRKSMEAIRTDGRPVYLYVKKRGSVACSCQHPLNYETIEETSHLKVGKVESKIIDEVSSEDTDGFSMSVRIRGDGVKDNILDSSMNNRRGKLPEIDDLVGDGLVIDNPEDGNFPAEPSGDLGDILSIFPSLGEKPCGQCGGTGFHDSYRWISGSRQILTAESAELSGNVNLNLTTKPHSLDISDSNATTYATWHVDVPAYFISLEIIRVMNNMEPCPELILEARDPAVANSSAVNAWTRPDADFFDAYKETGIRNLKLRVRVKTGKLNIGELSTFTHVEIRFKSNELPYCQFPQIDRDIQGGTLEALVNTQFEIEPSVGTITRESLIESPTHGRMWMVTSISNKATSKNFVFNITGNIQVLEPSAPHQGWAAIRRFSGKQPRHFRGIEHAPEGHGLPYGPIDRISNSGDRADASNRPYGPNALTKRKADGSR